MEIDNVCRVVTPRDIVSMFTFIFLAIPWILDRKKNDSSRLSIRLLSRRSHRAREHGKLRESCTFKKRFYQITPVYGRRYHEPQRLYGERFFKLVFFSLDFDITLNNGKFLNDLLTVKHI